MHGPIENEQRVTFVKPEGAGDRSAPRRRLVVGGAIAVLAVGLGLLIYPPGNWRPAKEAQTVAAREATSFVREGNRVRIPEGSPLRARLAVAAVSEKEMVRDLLVPAVVEADPARLMKVLPPVAGRIAELKVRLGERVERGQQLLVLDSPDLRTAYSEYDRAKALLDLAAKNRSRLHALSTGGGIALKEVQQADADFITAEAEYQRAEAHLRQIGVDPAAADKSRNVAITAPMSGSVVELAASPGAYWNDNTETLLTIADLSAIFVTANLPEKDLSRVAEGQAAEVVLSAYPGEVLKSTVAFVSDILEAETRRAKVRIGFANKDARLKPGMFANVTFRAPKASVPVVPATALVLKDDASQVYVEVAPWVFEARPVEVGFQQGDAAVIQSGVKAGERVIVRGGVLLND
ncbi:MAG TPA: efflux RND transporter periplasmic adaptor subunit [Xanthobacteraceae bacterium]|nr:efflux RND transporter periplasmic adaptor subunit [Xanthobacteraceae bacterium]